jgi:hypothetical protein
MQRYTSRILKAGAALDDTRRIVEFWDIQATVEENLQRIADENPLGKKSRARLGDLIGRAIAPRFIDPGPHVIPALKGLLSEHRAFTEACYFETARADSLLAAFAEGPVYAWWQSGKTIITAGDVETWLETQAKEGKTPMWSPGVRERAGQNLLSALRDFGVLRGVKGSPRKEIVSPGISPRGFAYVAWREHEQGASSRALVTTVTWRRWLLDADAVILMFDRVARLGLLRFSSAGSVVRIDWLAQSLAEVTGAAA